MRALRARMLNYWADNLRSNAAFCGLNIPMTGVENTEPEKTTIGSLTDLVQAD